MRITIVALLSLLSLKGMAQNIHDAVRFTDREFYSTARSQGMSGSFSALGADASSACVNPAGLGLFKRSEISATGNLFADFATTEHQGNEDFDVASKFGLGNLALVTTGESNKNSGVVRTSFSMGYNRLNDFHSNLTFSGTNQTSSLLDEYLYEVAGNGYQDPNEWINDPYYELGATLAWETYLLDTTSISGSPEYFHMNAFYGHEQEQQITTAGSLRETYFSYAWNINNRIYLGGTISFLRLTYTQLSTITETIDPEQTFNPLIEFSKTDYFETDASGMNLKLGLIYRISDYMRISAAYHSASNFTSTDEFYASMDSDFVNNAYEARTPTYSYKYNLRTPPRTILGAAWVLGKKGVVNIDYEQTNYAKAQFSDGDYNYQFQTENEEISNQLRRNHNLRLGAEYRLNSFYLRGGAHIANDVYNPQSTNERKEWGASLGLGAKWEKFYVDAAWRMTHRSSNHYMYGADFIDASSYNQSKHTLVATLGYRWQAVSYSYE